MVTNKLYGYSALALLAASLFYFTYDSGYSSGVNSEKVKSTALIIQQRDDYDHRVRLVAEYSNTLQTALYEADEVAATISHVEISQSKLIEKEVDKYVRREIENNSIIWLSDCWVRLHDNAATIAATMPGSNSDPASACMDDANAAKSAEDRPGGYYSAGEALKIVTENYEIAREWRRQLLAFQEREKEIVKLKFDNWKQLN